MKRVLKYLTTCAALVMPGVAPADEPVIEAVRIDKVGMVWNVHVTLRHPDTGWDHFADAWEVVDANGQRLAYRKLMHPHVDEQPFTRALSGVVLPDGTREVFLRGHCSVKGWSDTLFPVTLRP